MNRVTVLYSGDIIVRGLHLFIAGIVFTACILAAAATTWWAVESVEAVAASSSKVRYEIRCPSGTAFLLSPNDVSEVNQ